MVYVWFTQPESESRSIFIAETALEMALATLLALRAQTGPGQMAKAQRLLSLPPCYGYHKVENL